MKFGKRILMAFTSLCLAVGVFVAEPASFSVRADEAAVYTSEARTTSKETKKLTYDTLTLSDIPKYDSKPYVTVNKNVPFFYKSDLTENSFESYSELDELGRCGRAYACIGTDIMPIEERGSIGSVKPTGWHTIKYDNVDGKYLYNRCHLIGYQLSGENANEKNLITGTRYLNIEGMLPFENMTADYIKETGNHVLYRVTPMFDGKNLLAAGVLMEAYSIEDSGEGICFNVFCYNVQPDIKINYSDGTSSYVGKKDTSSSIGTKEKNTTDKTQKSQTVKTETKSKTYILNTNTKKFHNPSCSSVKQMSEKNKKEYTGSRDDIISQGYSPCKNCNP